MASAEKNAYVDDMVDALRRLIRTPAALRRPVNLGNPDEFGMLDLATLVRELAGSRAPIVFCRCRSGGPGPATSRYHTGAADVPLVAVDAAGGGPARHDCLFRAMAGHTL
jgi:nucleoside-diphosphate-sugar epimerase